MSGSGHTDSEGAGAWVAVGVLIAGALIVAGGIVATSWPVAIVGAAVIVLCLITTAIVHHLAGGAPVSFGEEYPATTSGPRATRDGDSRPPINTDPSARTTVD